MSGWHGSLPSEFSTLRHQWRSGAPFSARLSCPMFTKLVDKRVELLVAGSAEVEAKGQDCWIGSLSAFRTARASCSPVNGFSRRLIPFSSTPCLKMAPLV